MVTVTQVKAFISTVTSEQIGRCHKAFIGSVGYYLVENESGNFDADGELIEYKVQYSKEHGFTCTCKAGQNGFAHCKNNVCKHVVWSMACEAEVKAALAELVAPVVAPKPLTAKEQEFYRQEEVRQSEQASFLLALPSRNRK